MAGVLSPSSNLDSPFVITAPLAPLKAALNAQVDLDACFIPLSNRA
jgi:hypothetical protein